MSDLLAPVLVVMENEVDAFWCFAGFMELIGRNFEMDQSTMKQQMSQVSLDLSNVRACVYVCVCACLCIYVFVRGLLTCQFNDSKIHRFIIFCIFSTVALDHRTLLKDITSLVDDNVASLKCWRCAHRSPYVKGCRWNELHCAHLLQQECEPAKGQTD